MRISIESTPLADAYIVIPEVYQDNRGFFTEVYRDDQFRDLGLPDRFVQLNHSRSQKGVVRGLHFQWEPPMGKLMRVTIGSAFLAAVDIRRNSPTFGRWFGGEFSADNKRQLWAPAGFARGFCVLSDFAEIEYLCTGTYNSAHESGIAWDDPEIGIAWPVDSPILSEKDLRNAPLSAWMNRPESRFFSR